LGELFFSHASTQHAALLAIYLVTLAYQLATNFPSIQGDMNRAIIENLALLDPDKSLQDQMKTLFL
jgi:hypothetical protein